jgi:hypothetical protein
MECTVSREDDSCGRGPKELERFKTQSWPNARLECGDSGNLRQLSKEGLKSPWNYAKFVREYRLPPASEPASGEKPRTLFQEALQ